jgi:membrane fusion protein, multidrug efflux system
MGNINVQSLASPMPRADHRLAPLPFRPSMSLRKIVLIAATAGMAMALASCNQQKSTQNNAPAVKPEVSAMALHPQSVAITAELPGRTAAFLIAEVRPQVGGIIRSRNFKEGGEVKQGDILYEIDPSAYQAAYDSAVAAVEKAEGAVPSAQAKLDRYKGLSAQSVVSQQDFDNANATLVQAQADVASAKAALETARINLDYTKIRAPIDGRVGASTVTVGALVTGDQTTALTIIRTLDPINVDVTQSSVNLLKFRRAIAEGRLKTSGNSVSVHLTLEDGSSYKQTGVLEFSEAAVAETVGTINVRVVFPNPERILLPGMYVRATVEEGIADNSFLVPQRAVTRNTKGQPTAKFVSAEGKVQERVLSVQRSIGNSWLVNEGLKDGDRVIVEGSQRVRDGQDVNASPVTVDDATGELKQATVDTAKPVEQTKLENADKAASAGATK